MEIRTVSHQFTAYIADDGMDFYTKSDCLNYERRIKAVDAKKRMDTLPHFCECPPFVSDEEDWNWFYVKNQEEVKDIAIVLFDIDSVAHSFQPKQFPCWVAAVRTEIHSDKGFMLEYGEYIAQQDTFRERFDVQRKDVEGGTK